MGPLIISISGTTLSSKEKILLAHPKVGGLVLFKENYDNIIDDPKTALKKLVEEIRSINPNILIMIDHEGGKVWRFIKGFTKLPSAKEYGDLYDQDPALAHETIFNDGYIMAKELLDCGINMSLTPVVDLDGPSQVIGKLGRAYHKDPVVVVNLARAFIQGMKKAGMVATLKHFPGHGSCALDSHVTKPVDNRSFSELQNDLLPFKALIAQKMVGAVMSNFVCYPKVDPDNVAAFSEKWIKTILRSDLDFQLPVMSDCLSMNGADIGAQLERFQAAQNAGNDFLMYTHQHGKALDELLTILDRIPDTKEAAERRRQLSVLVHAGSYSSSTTRISKDPVVSSQKNLIFSQLRTVLTLLPLETLATISEYAKPQEKPNTV